MEIHNIEQPIKAGQWKLMKDLCNNTSLPIALDEELIGIHVLEEKIRFLETIQPQYIIIKPSSAIYIGKLFFAGFGDTST